MNKQNTILYSAAAILWAAFILLMVPHFKLQHQITVLQNTKLQLSWEIATISSNITELKGKYEQCVSDQAQWHEDADEFRSQKAIKQNKMEEVDRQLAKLLWIEFHQEDVEQLLWWGKLLGYKYFIVHHTATDPDKSVKDITDSRQRRYWRPAAHYVIDKDGNVENVLPLDTNAGSTMNNWKNAYAIQVEMIGNFNVKPPTLAQYKAIHELYISTQISFGELELIWHRDASPTACPWKKIDLDLIKNSKLSDTWTLTTYSISRYYSPMEGQSKYYPRSLKFTKDEQWCHPVIGNDWTQLRNWETGDYISDVCMNTSWNPMVWAWWRITKDMTMKIAACPPSLELWTTIYLDRWLTVKCYDRWWAIKNNRLDVWMWQWEEWLLNILNNKIDWGIYYWYIK